MWFEKFYRSQRGKSCISVTWTALTGSLSGWEGFTHCSRGRHLLPTELLRKNSVKTRSAPSICPQVIPPCATASAPMRSLAALHPPICSHYSGHSPRKRQQTCPRDPTDPGDASCPATGGSWQKQQITLSTSTSVQLWPWSFSRWIIYSSSKQSSRYSRPKISEK